MTFNVGALVCRQMPTPNRIARLRKAHGLSRVDIASRLGLKVERTVHRWETGESNVPDHHKLALADLFGVSVVYLMGWEENGDNGGNGNSERKAA